MNSNAKCLNVTRRELNRSLHEELLFTPEMPLVEYTNSKKIFIDAVKRGLQIFNLANFLEPTKWSKLTHLYLARNQLVDLPDELFYQAENLEWLDVRWNELQRFPTSVKEHACLKTVLLQENYLARLPIEFGSLENLQCLSVSHNPLEFPSPETLSMCPASRDLIKYLRQCWKEQSTDVLPSPNTDKKSKRRRVPKKIVSPRRVRDHTEVICKLRNSGKIKDQIRAEKMLQLLEFEQKLVQAFKDQEVLKTWRDTYSESQGNASCNDAGFPHVCSLLFSNNETFKLILTNELCEQSSREYMATTMYMSSHSRLHLLSRDIDSAISDLQKQLRQSRISHTGSADISTNPELIMRERSRDIDNMKSIKKKITYLKQRCGK